MHQHSQYHPRSIHCMGTPEHSGIHRSCMDQSCCPCQCKWGKLCFLVAQLHLLGSHCLRQGRHHQFCSWVLAHHSRRCSLFQQLACTQCLPPTRQCLHPPDIQKRGCHNGCQLSLLSADLQRRVLPLRHQSRLHPQANCPRQALR